MILLSKRAIRNGILGRLDLVYILFTLTLLMFLFGFFNTTMANPIKGVGTENRQWVNVTESQTPPPPFSNDNYEITAQEDIKIPMRDGVELNSRLLLPAMPETPPLPCILLMNPYGHTGYVGEIIEGMLLRGLIAKGYAGMHVSMRGIGGSTGEAGLYDYYSEDGYDIVEWIASQPWCNGNVGTFGPSRLGIPQWRTARENPPHLMAVIPDVACGDCYFDHWYRGGALPGPGRYQPNIIDIALEHRNFDAFWRERSTIKKDHKAIARNDIPVMVFGGWMDYISRANMNAYRDYSAKGDKGKMIIGPWPHSTGAGLLPYNKLDYHTLWFDRYLKGWEDNVLDDEPAVLIYVQGAEQWRFEEAWPIPDARVARLYLRAEGSTTINSLNDGSLLGSQPAKKEVNVSYSYDPVTGPFLPIGLDSREGRLTIDQRPFEESVLTWTSGELDTPTEITGYMKFKFWASATEPDTDFILQITDVAPDGESIQVSTGVLNAPRYFDRANPPTLKPGKIYQYKIEVEPTSWVFKEGHRIRLDLAGGCDHSIQTRPQGPGLNPNASEITIYQDAKHPSCLEFPVIGTALLPTEVLDDDDGD